MELILSKHGTVTDCREVLNDKIREVSAFPRTEYESVVRATASYIVQELLDKLHDPWADMVNKCRAAGAPVPQEPTCGFEIACRITLTVGA